MTLCGCDAGSRIKELEECLKASTDTILRLNAKIEELTSKSKPCQPTVDQQTSPLWDAVSDIYVGLGLFSDKDLVIQSYAYTRISFNNVDKLKTEIAKWERLNGTAPVVDADYLINAYDAAHDYLDDCSPNKYIPLVCSVHNCDSDNCQDVLTSARAALKSRIQAAPPSPSLVRNLELTIRAKLMERDAIYKERNSVVAGLAYLAQRNGWTAYRTKHVDIPYVSWDADWRTVIIIEIPTGQISWHVHDSDVPLFDHLPYREVSTYDGHRVEEKYERLAALTKSTAPPESQDTERLIGNLVRACHDLAISEWSTAYGSAEPDPDARTKVDAARNALRSALSRRPVTAEELFREIMAVHKANPGKPDSGIWVDIADLSAALSKFPYYQSLTPTDSKPIRPVTAEALWKTAWKGSSPLLRNVLTFAVCQEIVSEMNKLENKP